MARVWLVQLLCPERHAVMAAPYEKETEDQATEIADGIKDQMKEKGFIWECGICKSTELLFEEGPTRFMSLDEAIPHIKNIERENILTRLIIDAMRTPGEAGAL